MSRYIVTPLSWEEDYFGVTACKVTLCETVTAEDIHDIKKINQIYDFVTIQNNANNFENNFKLREIPAYLVDINQQFEFSRKWINTEKTEGVFEKRRFNNSELSEILKMIEQSFYVSRFFNETNLPETRYNVYKEWFLNSLNDEEKNFFVTYDNHDEIDSFMLVSHNSTNIIIELICSKGKGKGTKLLRFLKNNELNLNKQADKIIVGTQLDNIKAQNFYIKNGFVHFNNNSIYHLWS